MSIELKNIQKTYLTSQAFFSSERSLVKAVDDVSLSIKGGENFGLVGESGCGKTTLARIIVRLVRQDGGSISYEGKKIENLRGEELKDYRRCVQMVFQDPFSSLDPRFTVRSSLKEALVLEKSSSVRSHAEGRMRDALSNVGLKPEMLNRYPHELSGGERQRVAIARALIVNPKFVILDEAVSSLDVIIQGQIIDLLRNLQSKLDMTYFFISHNLKVIRKLCQNVAIMYKGRIVEQAPCEEIFNNPLHPYTRELLTAAFEYRSRVREKEIIVGSGAQLIDRGAGHFVLDE